jgi:stage V sporulation protein AE
MAVKNVILITDGDETACETIENAGKKLGLRTISKSAGNPTPRDGKEIIELIKESDSDTVLVMFDDEGDKNKGAGEEALGIVLEDSDIEVLGVVAVASQTKDVRGIKADFSVSNEGEIIDGPVDKKGDPEAEGNLYLEGDTVDIINKFDPPLVVGIGDVGKMNRQDALEKGSPITIKAIEEILSRSES